ncbi:hypothetical protein CFE70_005592 [Pyrenophora teres f. teres 0-1]
MLQRPPRQHYWRAHAQLVQSHGQHHGQRRAVGGQQKRSGSGSNKDGFAPRAVPDDFGVRRYAHCGPPGLEQQSTADSRQRRTADSLKRMLAAGCWLHHYGLALCHPCTPLYSPQYPAVLFASAVISRVSVHCDDVATRLGRASSTAQRTVSNPVGLKHPTRNGSIALALVVALALAHAHARALVVAATASRILHTHLVVAHSPLPPQSLCRMA